MNCVCFGDVRSVWLSVPHFVLAGLCFTSTRDLLVRARRESSQKHVIEYMDASAPAPAETEAVAKSKRYDRQLRLWGEHGQAAMEACKVCLLNGSACGAETLKNLVLPGACM